jgi:Ca2+/Na+ antiporter
MRFGVIIIVIHSIIILNQKNLTKINNLETIIVSMYYATFTAIDAAFTASGSKQPTGQ